MAILLALVTMVCLGAADYTGGIVAKKEDAIASVLSRELPELVAMFVLIALVFPSHPSVRDLLLGAGSGLAVAVALPTFFHALANGSMGIIAPLTGTVSASLPVVVGIVSGEKPSTLQLIGIVFALIGVVFISIEKGEGETDRKHVFGKDVPMALICGSAFGVYFVLMHHTSKASGLAPIAAGSTATVVALAIYGAFTTKRFVVKREYIKLNSLGAVLDLAGATAFIYATRDGLLSVVSVVCSLYPVITVVLALILLRERFGKTHTLGLGAAVLALGLISAG